MRFIKLSTILVPKEYLAKINNLPNHHGAGPPEARGPLRRGAQCSCIGCIDLRPALVAGILREILSDCGRGGERFSSKLRSSHRNGKIDLQSISV